MTEVSVYLSGGEAFMTQHLLHGTEVSTILHQFGCKAVAQTVGRDVLVETRLFDSFLDELENRNAREVVAAKIEEYIFFLAWLRCELAAEGVDIVVEQMQRMAVDGYPTFLIALADNLEHFLFKINIGQLEIDQFGDPKATAIQHFDDNIIAGGSGKAAVESVLKSRYVLVGKHVG